MKVNISGKVVESRDTNADLNVNTFEDDPVQDHPPVNNVNPANPMDVSPKAVQIMERIANGGLTEVNEDVPTFQPQAKDPSSVKTGVGNARPAEASSILLKKLVLRMDRLEHEISSIKDVLKSYLAISDEELK